MARPSKTALFEAAKRWDVATIAPILDVAPELVAATDAQGRMPLHAGCAVKPGWGRSEPDGIATANALLVAGAELEAAVPMAEDEGDFRATPLWYATARGENHPLVRFLLARGADPSFCLWAAVWRDDAELCRTLLAARPRLDLRAHGETAIFYAARLRRLRTLDLLMEAGADPTIADDRGRDVLAIARERRLPPEIVDRLARFAERAQSPA